MAKLIHFETVEALTGQPFNTIGRLILAELFPAPVSNDDGVPVWDLHQVKEWKGKALADPARYQ